MALSGLQRQDTTKGPPLRILSLDGGGVRGYSMLILLQELMHRTYVEIHGAAPKAHEVPKPCDHFDLIAGTGTGGLIAIMLGRLRLDIETCKDVYVRMTRRVFETDKTFAGIPYRSTLFKASKLEEAIRECVREHTVFDDEGNDSLANAQPMAPMTPTTSPTVTGSMRGVQRSMSSASRASGISPVTFHGSTGSGRWGNPDALLYDVRENRTKTAVTAVYRGTPMTGNSALLRSYDSRKEPPPEVNCAIWQAGRATCAIGLAFKPIQIGQSVFIDEGAGKYNPAPQVLDEAALNEWPGREVGVFVSIGTGKRPPGTNQQQEQWWEAFCGGSMGDFAQAKRRLFQKIEGCEATHQYMMQEHLIKRQVNPENYYRLNVEVGVGEFGMNEWNQLTEISTNTRMYLSRTDVQNVNLNAAAKLSRIHRAKIRHDRLANGTSADHPRLSYECASSMDEIPPPSIPNAVELPAADVYPEQRPGSQYPPVHASAQQSYHRYQQSAAPDDKYVVVSSADHPQPEDAISYQEQQPPPTRWSADSYTEPLQAHRHPVINSNDSSVESSPPHRPRPSVELPPHRMSPPPLPPKTPLSVSNGRQHYQIPQAMSYAVRVQNVYPRPSAGVQLPYPDTDGPPPPVNMARKPQYGIREG